MGAPRLARDPGSSARPAGGLRGRMIGARRARAQASPNKSRPSGPSPALPAAPDQ